MENFRTPADKMLDNHNHNRANIELFYTNETNTLKINQEKVGDIMTFLKKTTNRRVGSFFAVAALVLATITPGLVPAFASAAQVTERSVTISSASKASEDVSYQVQFTSVGAAKAIVLDFCNDTPLIGVECTAPTGFDVSAATVGSGSVTTVTVANGDASSNSTIVLNGTIAAATAIDFTLEGIENPANPGALYIRVLTFDGADTAAADAKAQAYVDTTPGDVVDTGTAAVSITDTIGVSAAVNETMTFCVAGAVIATEGCAGADSLAPPTVKLGDETTNALSSTEVSEGSIYSQISTNAAGGAVVALKSGNECGGLKRAVTDADVCDIAATTDGTGIAGGQPRFGIKVDPAANPVGTATGTLQIVDTGTPFYSSSIFKLNYVAGGASGVTSPFGDQVLDTAAAPANSKNAQITFGASISNDTPAGLYSNDFSLIATGKF